MQSINSVSLNGRGAMAELFSESKSNDQVERLSCFWLRQNGFSLQFSKVKKLNQLEISEQLFAAVLRLDRTAVRTLLQSQEPEKTAAQFLKIVKEAQFALLVMDRLYEMAVVSDFPEVLRSQLRDLATAQITEQANYDKQFSEILKELSPLCDQLVWIKGTALKQLVYANPNHRQSGDFDVVVRPQALPEVLAKLEGAGFFRLDSEAYCNQIGVGPVDRYEDLLLAPAQGWIPSSAISMCHGSWPYVDVKLGPFDRGVQMHQIERFFADSVISECRKQKFRVPNLVDQMLISLHTFEKDKFKSWKNLLDIHLLAREMESQDLWHTLVDRCKLESLSVSAWASLVIASDRLGTAVPSDVLEHLAPNLSFIERWARFTVSPYFVWNATSLPMMLLNATVSGDKERKLTLLRESVFPSRGFLSNYYDKRETGKAQAARLRLAGVENPICVIGALLCHWIVLILPGGITRRTFGIYLWPVRPQEVSLDDLPCPAPGSKM